MVERLRHESDAVVEEAGSNHQRQPEQQQQLVPAPAAPQTAAEVSGGPLRISVDCAEEACPSDGSTEDYRFLWEACQEIAETYLADEEMTLQLLDGSTPTPTPTSVLESGKSHREPRKTNVPAIAVEDGLRLERMGSCKVTECVKAVGAGANCRTHVEAGDGEDAKTNEGVEGLATAEPNKSQEHQPKLKTEKKRKFGMGLSSMAVLVSISGILICLRRCV